MNANLSLRSDLASQPEHRALHRSLGVDLVIWARLQAYSICFPPRLALESLTEVGQKCEQLEVFTAIIRTFYKT